MYGFEKQMQPEFKKYGCSSGTPSYMMMYPLCTPKNDAPSPIANYPAPIPQAPGGGTTVLLRQPYGYPVGNVVTSSGLCQDDSDIDSGFEVHDNRLKAPITVWPRVVYQSLGSQRLFGSQKFLCVGTRNVPRICELFQEGSCVLGENCADVHVSPEFLSETRRGMVSWLHGKEQEFKQTLVQAPQTVFRVFCADLKEVVQVPVSSLRFTKGLYVDHGLRARRTRGGHQNQFAAMASQVPTACGLFSMDPAQCKWGRWCNQVHIDLNWMQSRKNEFATWANQLEEQFNALPPDYLFTVHDPQMKASLKLPKASIAGFSRGLFQGSQKKSPSICMLYQRNRCTANSCCNQIHVVQPYLNLCRRLWNARTHLTEEESRSLETEIGSLYQRLAAQLKGSNASASATLDDSGDAAALNPQATPFVPTPGLQISGSGNDKDTSETQQRHTSPFNLQPQRRGSQRQCISPVNNSGISQNRSISGFVMPLGELASIPDAEERSLSSLHASQSNISHAGQSYRHTHNPYAVGGNASCSATTSFGWVQPIRSAGNSVTTIPTMNCIGYGNTQIAEYGGPDFNGPKQAFPATVDSRPCFFGSQQQSFDMNVNPSTSPLLRFNASSSTYLGSKGELQRGISKTPDGGMFHTC